MTDAATDAILHAICELHDHTDLWMNTRRDPNAFRAAVKQAWQTDVARRRAAAPHDPLYAFEDASDSDKVWILTERLLEARATIDARDAEIAELEQELEANESSPMHDAPTHSDHMKATLDYLKRNGAL